MDSPRILVVDEDAIVADALADFLRSAGLDAQTAGDAESALERLRLDEQTPPDQRPQGQGPFGVLVTELALPRVNGLELLKRVQKAHPSVVPIVVTGYAKIASAVEAVKRGAADYLTKPIIDDELRLAVEKALRQHQLLAENHHLRRQLSQRFGLDKVVGSDHRMQRVYDLVETVASSKTTVLIEGESGTGKSLIAHSVHAHSPRKAGPFITFACGSIPETLLESELFGHVRGAFTGADQDKPGKVLAAEGGTLFIDEINSATPTLQLKLLRVLQERKFEPVGATRTLTADVRFVLATNQPLEPLVRQGAFREDLYYRINVVAIRLPALRDREGDVPLLAQHFLEKYRVETGKAVTAFSDEAMQAMRRHRWPGNVRELENAVERAVVLARRPTLELADLPESLHAGEAGEPLRMAGGPQRVQTDGGQSVPELAVIPALARGWTPMPLEEALREPERRILQAALEANHWNRQKTAAELGINRTTLYKKMRLLGLDHEASLAG